MNETANGSQQIKDMADDKIMTRLHELRTSGTLGNRGDYEFKMSMAFSGAVNREAEGRGNGPTDKVRRIAEQIYRAHRYDRTSVPEMLIDPDDNPEAEARAQMYAEF